MTGYLTPTEKGFKIPNNEIKEAIGNLIFYYYETIYKLDDGIMKQLTSILQEIFDYNGEE